VSLHGVANLPFHIHRHTNPTRAGQRFNPRSNVYSVAINIAAAMHNVANMNADFDFNAAIRLDICVRRQMALAATPSMRRDSS
jgi:hypothetical protein